MQWPATPVKTNPMNFPFKSKALRLILACSAVLMMTPGTGNAASDSTRVQRYNVVKLDFTSRWFFNNAYVASYERITWPNQSVGVTFGYQELPEFSILPSDVFLKRINERNGLKVGAEYRFYLGNENRHPAPRGVYLGPYFTFLSFNGDRTIEVATNEGPQEGQLLTEFRVANLGLQLGYQFIILKRISLDLVLLGPSFSHYRAKMDLDGDFTIDPEDLENEILQKLIDRFPGLNELIVDKTIEAAGRNSTWGYGWRYQLHIGYHFRLALQRVHPVFRV
jgi:hypothetical protein